MKPIDTFYLIIVGLTYMFILLIFMIIGIIGGKLAAVFFLADVLFLSMIMVTLKNGRN